MHNLVSILIPFKNSEPFLKECIESILRQTYTQWEVIAVNDGSQDQSLARVKAYSEKDSRIEVLENKGKGIIAALRIAYAQSRGSLVTRMDSDDIMAPNRLQVMVDALHQKGKGHLAVGQVKYFSHRGISNGYERYEKWINNLTVGGKNYNEIYKECVIPSPCWMTYREDLDRCGAFNLNRYPEDYDLTFRFYENALQCIPCKEVLHYWRDYDTRTSRTSAHYAQNYFLDIKLHYFLKLDYDATRPLAVWGAGTKGKKIAKGLRKKDIPFYWLCDNPKKIGNKIYGLPMLNYNELEKLKSPQSIVTVANEKAQAEIRHYLTNLEQKELQDYFFFC